MDARRKGGGKGCIKRNGMGKRCKVVEEMGMDILKQLHAEKPNAQYLFPMKASVTGKSLVTILLT